MREGWRDTFPECGSYCLSFFNLFPTSWRWPSLPLSVSPFLLFLSHFLSWRDFNPKSDTYKLMSRKEEETDSSSRFCLTQNHHVIKCTIEQTSLFSSFCYSHLLFPFFFTLSSEEERMRRKWHSNHDVNVLDMNLFGHGSINLLLWSTDSTSQRVGKERRSERKRRMRKKNEWRERRKKKKNTDR